MVPAFMKAPDLIRNSARAAIPVSEPRRFESARCLEAFRRMCRYWAYLGQSLMMWFLDSRVLLSHGQFWGSGERGRNARRNSPV